MTKQPSLPQQCVEPVRAAQAPRDRADSRHCWKLSLFDREGERAVARPRAIQQDHAGL